MFGIDFFPTPAPVVERMLAPYKDTLGARTILEPSAGKGDIANAINDPERSHFKHTYDLECLEVDPNLVSVLQGNGHKIAGFDFLTFQPRKIYDLILMNPPFSAGDKHLLHAWSILEGGDIACLLNAETIQNPFSKTRKLLAHIIEKHGEVEYLGPCFDTAERKTNVEVALVRLHKPSVDKFKALFERASLVRTAEQFEFKDPEEILLPATRDKIGAIVLQFEESLELYKKMLVMGKRLSTSLQGARGKGVEGESYRNNGSDAYIKENIFSGNFKHAYNQYVEQLTEEAWRNVIRITNLDHLMTARVRASFDSHMKKGSVLAFTKENIFAVLDGLRENVVAIMTEALNEVFELLTKHHYDNREFVEGWKTNDQFKIKKRFILPSVVRYDDVFKSFTTAFSSWETHRDIDRVMCSLTGQKIEDIISIDTALRSSFKSPSEGQAESEFFTIRYYKKGSAHFTFKDNSLRERFCIEYAKDKNWLPSNYTYEQDGPIISAIACAETTKACQLAA